MKIIRLSLFMIVLGTVFYGCRKEDNNEPAGQWDNTIFVVNEGPFQSGSGTISAYHRETGVMTPNIFETVNGRPLGNIVQSMAIANDRAFIVVNNANKVEVVSMADFTSVATIENLVLPRYFLAVNSEKAYVSCWDNTVKEISMSDYTVKREIQAGTGPDEMILSDGRVFVINSGGYGTDSTVTYFSVNDEEDFGRLTVGHRPVSIVKDANGKLWVLCAGIGWNGFPAPGDTRGRLVCLDPSTLNILVSIEFPDAENHPEGLVADKTGSFLYFLQPSGIFRFGISQGSLPSSPFIHGDKMYYGIGVDPVNSMVLVADPLDYAQNGWVYRYDGEDGSPVDSLQAGVVPNGFCFN